MLVVRKRRCAGFAGVEEEKACLRASGEGGGGNDAGDKKEDW